MTSKKETRFWNTFAVAANQVIFQNRVYYCNIFLKTLATATFLEFSRGKRLFEPKSRGTHSPRHCVASVCNSPCRAASVLESRRRSQARTRSFYDEHV